MNEQQIVELDDRQKSREKIDVWFGSNSNYYHPIREGIQNAIDEVENNFEKGIITITLSDDRKKITIEDTGRGMPIVGKTKSGNENWKALFLTLFAGGKYYNNEIEQQTGGTNGVGNTVTNYTSEYFSCRSYFKGKEYFIEFENGGKIKTALVEIGETEKHGTVISFILDSKIYTETIFNDEEVGIICKRYAACAHKTTIVYVYKEIKMKFYFNNIEEYFDEISHNLTSSKVVGYEKNYEKHINIIYEDKTTQSHSEKDSIEIVMATSSSPVQEAFLNYNYLKEGGTINKGIIRGVKNFLSKYIKEKTKLKIKLSDKDIEDSLSFVCKFKSTAVSYSNQTKFSTSKEIYKEVAEEYIKEILEVFLIENEKGFKKILDHVLKVQEFNDKNQKSIKKLKNELVKKVDSIYCSIENFDDCKKHDENSEIFICEGLSAKGSIILSRDAIYQAVIAMKGKVLNCLKASYSEILSNKAIFNLIRALGCGIVGDRKNKNIESFNINNLRYGKIFLAADADPDGAQIVCLLLTMIYRLMPELLLQGKIYIVCTPLYENKLKNDEMIYTFSEDEQKEIVKKFNTKIAVVNRSKGLGEMDAEILAETGVNPNTRFVKRVVFEDKEKMDAAFENWMCDKTVTFRKDYLMKHLNKYLKQVI